ncbi:MAG: sulfite exporter TauE/SafE family protein [Alphaproteobacteria bacterium]
MYGCFTADGMMLIAVLLLLGVLSGFMAGLFGIGGSMLMVPFLVWWFDHLELFHGSSIKFAIASAMAVVVFTSLSSIRAHYLKGAINWHLVKVFTIGILPGGLVASLAVFGILKSSWLYFLFAGLVLLSAKQMWVGAANKNIIEKKISNKKYQPKDVFKILPRKWLLVVMGAVVGFLSGLVGAGGGFLMVPFQTRFGIMINRAVATSAATGFPIALVNSFGFLLADSSHLVQSHSGRSDVIGFVYWPAVSVIALASVLAAPFGAKLAHDLPLQTLRRIFAIGLFVMAVYMAWRGWQF